MNYINSIEMIKYHKSTIDINWKYNRNTIEIQ
ncbi:MAG: hypothetical protein PWP52_1564, partial [Bacteroidales bacterium]|nr:hypothetical protein [Bacteroidales bacterium]